MEEKWAVSVKGSCHDTIQINIWCTDAVVPVAISDLFSFGHINLMLFFHVYICNNLFPMAVLQILGENVEFLAVCIIST